MENTNKPPPIRVAVHGFNAFKSKPSKRQQDPPDWPRLESLPPFQMFLAEKRVLVKHTQDFYEDYCKWHMAKGYWPDEDVHGRLM